MDHISRYSADSLRFLRDLLSTITSPVFSDVIIVFEARVGVGAGFTRSTLFGMVRNMYKVKPFRLVFCLWVWDGNPGDEIEKIKGMIDTEAAEGELGFLPYPPSVVSYTRLAWHRENLGNILPITARPPAHSL